MIRRPFLQNRVNFCVELVHFAHIGVRYNRGPVLRTRKPLLGRILKSVGISIALLVTAPYVWGPIYRFPEPRLFTGSALWNPYANLSGNWQRANLHAHGRAWSGLTNGQQSDEAVAQRYRELGYSVPGVSRSEERRVGKECRL